MSPEEILLQQVWSMINEEHGEVLMSDNLQSRIESAFNVYAREYHQKEMERKLEDITEERIREVAKDFYHVGDDKDLPLECGRLQGIKWLLTHLKEQKQDKV